MSIARVSRVLTVSVALLASVAAPAAAQDLGPHVRKVRDGIYVYAAKPADSNVTIIETREGLVLVDTGQTPADARAVQAIVKKLSLHPVRFIIHTEPHGDHASGNFVFSPPAIVIAHAGAAESMKKSNFEARNKQLVAANPEMREAVQGYRLVTPHIEYNQKMTLAVGERTLELIYLKNVHSEADTAIWMPQERILWAAASVGVKRYPNLRPFLTIDDILASIRMMRALNPEVVIAGHGEPGTTQIFDEMERYYMLLLERVGNMARLGKSLEEIKEELRMPEFDDWAAKERLSSNVELAYKAVKGN
jgi:cyclase